MHLAVAARVVAAAGAARTAARVLSSGGGETEGAAATQLLQLPPPPEAPGARTPLLGSAVHLAAFGGPQLLHQFVDERHKRYGRIYADRLGPTRGVFVCDAAAARRLFAVEGPCPRHIVPEAWLLFNELSGTRRGLLFMDGEEWWRHRRVLNRLLLRPQALGAAEAAAGVAARALAVRWGRLPEATGVGGALVPALEHELYLWALEAAGALLLGADAWGRRREQLLPLAGRVAASVRGVFEHSSRLSLLPAALAHTLRLGSWRAFEEAVRDTLSAAREMVLAMEGCGGEMGLLQQLSNAGVAREDVHRLVVDLLLAAGDTTVHSLQWLLLCLARQPALQERLAEKVQASAHASSQASADALAARLPELRWVVRETLRLYPVAPFITRFLPSDSELAGCRLTAGTLVMLSLYSSGRDERYFRRPLDFWPERWSRSPASIEDNGQKGRCVGAYVGVADAAASLPFAAGARSCVGRRVAEAQLTLAAAELLRHFRLRVDNEAAVEMRLRMVAVPSEPLQLRLLRPPPPQHPS